LTVAGFIATEELVSRQFPTAAARVRSSSVPESPSACPSKS